MEELPGMIADIAASFAAQEQARNLAMDRSRKIIRMTKAAIHAIHEGQRDPQALPALQTELDALVAALLDTPGALEDPAVGDAMIEYAETALFDSAVRGAPLPSCRELRITPAAWTLGLGDSVGELRRVLLRDLMAGDLAAAQTIFGRMEEMGDALLSLDVPDAIAPIRRKQDLARGVIEKSRTDLATALIMNRR